jgi:poly(glycerol-phosphate) alpha-glucosyltransferase
MPSGIEIGEAFISDRPVADPYILYLGRLHPKKNLEAAIDAWAAMGEARGNSRFVIAGWGDEVYVADLVKRLEAVGPRTGIDYIGPVYGGGKERILAGARFLLLPSLSEGLPMTILEAWAEGVPVLMSSQCNLPEGFAAGAALDCGISAETIRATLVRALAIAQEERRTMSVAARDLVARKFSMTRVTESWTDIYRGLLAPSRIDGQHISESRSGRFNVPAG